MTCPACEAKLEVLKTMVLPGHTLRLRECSCGQRYETIEKVVRKLPVPPATNGQPARNGPSEPGNPSEVSGGIGGGVSSGFDPQTPDSNPGLRLLSEPRARARSRQRATDEPYSEAFEEVWRETGRHGNKHPAFMEWIKWGRWPWRQLGPIYGAYLKSERPAKLGAIQDLRTWLHGRGHLQEWVPWSPPHPQAPIRAAIQLETAREVAATDRKAAELRAAAARAATPEQIEELRRQRNGAAK